MATPPDWAEHSLTARVHSLHPPQHRGSNPATNPIPWLNHARRPAKPSKIRDVPGEGRFCRGISKSRQSPPYQREDDPAKKDCPMMRENHANGGDKFSPGRPGLLTLLVAAAVIAAGAVIAVIVNWGAISALIHLPQIKSSLGF